MRTIVFTAIVLFIWRYLIMNEEKKDIRFIAVDYGDPEIQKLMSNDDNSFVEINKEKFERQNDGLETSFRTMNNYVSLTGSLLAPAKVINHGPHQFIYAQLIVDTGYFNSSNKFQKHQECVPLRFNMSMSRVLLLKSSDTLQIAGRIIRFIGEDDTDPTKAMSYYYIQVQNCGLMFPIATGYTNQIFLTGKLQADPQVIINHSQNDYKFVSANLVIPDGYKDKKGKYVDHKEVIPLRFFSKQDEIMAAKQGDTVQITGFIKSWGNRDPKKDTMHAAAYFYVLVKGFGIMYGSSIRKIVKHKFYPRTPKKNNENNDQLAKMIGNISPEKQAYLLSLLQHNNGQPEQQSKDETPLEEPQIEDEDIQNIDPSEMDSVNDDQSESDHLTEDQGSQDNVLSDISNEDIYKAMEEL